MTKYIDHLRSAMEMLAEKPDTLFVGYNSTAGGTANCFPSDRRIEMPLAEPLCAGVSIGLSLGGFIPVLWVERMDFMTLMMDQVVNHLSKLAELSEGIHKPAVIIRACVGNRHTPLFTGPTHCQNFSMAFRHLVSFPVIELKWSSSVLVEYQKAYERAKQGQSTLLVEFKDIYNEL